MSDKAYNDDLAELREQVMMWRSAAEAREEEIKQLNEQLRSAEARAVQKLADDLRKSDAYFFTVADVVAWIDRKAKALLNSPPSHPPAQPVAQVLEWMPIDSAPKDGSSVLLRSMAGTGVADGYWLQSAYNGNGAWIWPYVHKVPTHWMPIPAASPQGSESE